MGFDVGFDMGFDIINGPEPTTKPVKRIHAQTKYYGDTPHNAVIQEIYENMTCMDVLNYSHYVFFRRTQEVRFGSQLKTVEQVCMMFPQCPARSMAVTAEVGPPNRRGMRLVTLAQLLNDWYWLAKTAKSSYIIDKFQVALQNRGITCKV